MIALCWSIHLACDFPQFPQWGMLISNPLVFPLSSFILPCFIIPKGEYLMFLYCGLYWHLLSPVPVFTSDPFPIPPIILIPLPRLLSDFLSSFRSCYLLISFVLFPFIPAYPFLSNPFCSHATDNHVLTQPHVSLIAPPPFLRYPFPLRPLTPNSSCI